MQLYGGSRVPVEVRGNAITNRSTSVCILQSTHRLELSVIVCTCPTPPYELETLPWAIASCALPLRAGPRHPARFVRHMLDLETTKQTAQCQQTTPALRSVTCNLYAFGTEQQRAAGRALTTCHSTRYGTVCESARKHATLRPTQRAIREGRSYQLRSAESPCEGRMEECNSGQL